MNDKHQPESSKTSKNAEFISNDTLTGLITLHHFLHIAQDTLNSRQEKAEKNDWCFVYFNLIGFRKYNVRHGLEKGDEFLCEVAGVLRGIFPGNPIARWAGDHFLILSKEEDLMERIQKAHEEIFHLGDGRVDNRCGVYAASHDDNVTASAACDYAKIACDSIRNSSDTFVQIYSGEVARQVRMRAYISDNIDAAIENGWIQIYYQPVIRTISGSLCGMEALTRWIDPKYGFLKPSDFISVLEESRQIWKLDSFVIEGICRKLREEMNAGRDVVPISFNLSRRDFDMCDMFHVTDDAVSRYDIPRSLIHVEITESIIISDRERISREINRFRSAGYQVWMDDFGSGYSSLNVLKDYHFDDIKIDMEFLRQFSDVSREIVASTVRMAKNISTHTLAEGAETPEHVDFLRQIGCEKMQGYFFGKPAPYQESMQLCKSKGLLIDRNSWRNYYSQIGMVNTQTDKAITIIDYADDAARNSGKAFTFLFANLACSDLYASLGYSSMKDVEHDVNVSDFMNQYRLLDFMNGFHWGEYPVRPRENYIAVRGHYLSLLVEPIVSMEDHHALLVTIHDVTRDKNIYAMRQMDFVTRSLFMAYDNIITVHYTGDYMEPRQQDIFFRQLPGTRYHAILTQRKKYSGTVIHPCDRERFLTFTDPATILDRIRRAEIRSVIGQFRSLGPDGRYHWKVHNVFSLTDDGEQILLYTIKDSVIASDPVAAEFYRKRYDTDTEKRHPVR